MKPANDKVNSNLTEGDYRIGMLKFAFPIFMGQFFQQCYNLADAIVVGNFESDTALAAVTSTASLVFLMVGFFGGLFTGASVVISRFVGAKNDEKIPEAVGAAVAFGLTGGIVLTIVGTVFAPQILQIMQTPQDVFEQSTIYIRTLFSGIIFTVLYNTACGIFQAVGDSKRPLFYLILSAIINISLDVVFVGILKIGVAGAALATVIAQSVSVILAFTRLFRIDSVYALKLKNIRLRKDLIKNMISIGLPSGIQNSVSALGNVVVQSSINTFGAAAMAGNGAYTKIEGFVFIPITSFATAITIFVSQNIGAGNYERVKSGTRFAILFSCLTAQTLGYIFFFFPEQLFSIFGENVTGLSVGIQRASIGTLFYFLLSFSHCIASVMRGAGRSKVPMVVMLLCWCGIRVTYVTIVTHLFNDIRYIFWAYPLTWFLSASIFLYCYLKLDWLDSAKLQNQIKTN